MHVLVTSEDLVFLVVLDLLLCLLLLNLELLFQLLNLLLLSLVLYLHLLDLVLIGKLALLLQLLVFIQQGDEVVGDFFSQVFQSVLLIGLNLNCFENLSESQTRLLNDLVLLVQALLVDLIYRTLVGFYQIVVDLSHLIVCGLYALNDHVMVDLIISVLLLVAGPLFIGEVVLSGTAVSVAFIASLSQLLALQADS